MRTKDNEILIDEAYMDIAFKAVTECNDMGGTSDPRGLRIINNYSTLSMVAGMTSYGKRIGKLIVEREKLDIDCRRLLEFMYAPSVCSFMMELAIKRRKVGYMRELLSMGLTVDDTRRAIMAERIIPPNAIMTAIINDLSRNPDKFFGDIPFRNRGRFGNIWQRLRFRIRYWKAGCDGSDSN